MARKKHSDIDGDKISSLCASIYRSRQALEPYRRWQFDAVKQYIGHRWSWEAAPKEVPVNLTAQYVRIVSQYLVAKNPRFLYTTTDSSKRPAVKAMQAWANEELVNMQFEMTLRRAVVNALFSIGIIKVAIADPARAAIKSWNLSAGRPFAEIVDLEDFAFDIHAHSWEEVGWIGHKYRAPMDVVKSSNLISKKAKKDLQPTEDRQFNEQGDERLSMLQRGFVAGNRDEFDDYIDLWEIYLPRHRVIVTLLDTDVGAKGIDDTQMEAVSIQDWVGPDTGPYHILGFNIVPGNAMPLAPVQLLSPLHDAANNNFRKIFRMAERIKSVGIYQRNNAEDAETISLTDDGGFAGLSKPDAVQEVTFGASATQAVMGTAMLFKQLYNELGGNLALLGGQGAQSPTASQDKMLNQNAGAGMADMQTTTTSFAGRVGKALSWYWWYDPYHVMQTQHQVQGVPEASITRQVHPFNPQAENHQPLQQAKAVMRKGPFESLQIKVEPYSMQYLSPDSRLQFVNGIVQQIVPMLPMLAPQGITFDANFWLSLVAEYGDSPDVAKLFTIMEPPEGNPGGGDQPQGGPPETTRNYVRESRSSRTDQGTAKDSIMRMMGHDTGGASNGQPQMAQ